MWSKTLAIGLSLLLLLFSVAACEPEPVASISVDKMVMVEGGDTWVEEVEQCVCQNVEFQVIVRNNGDGPLVNIVVSDLIPSGLEYIPASAAPSAGGTLINPVWNFDGPLNPGDIIEITFSAHVASEGEHENCVKVQAVGKVQAETDDGVVDALDCAVVKGTICEPEHKMHYPQYPDEHGWDVYSCKSASLDEMIQVADDWECSETGKVENIRFWGSWKDDVLGEITGFHIEIYSNSLAGDYSHPDVLLWESFITNYTSQEIQTPVPEGWYNPFTDSHEDYNHNAYYRYDISDIQDAFCQEEGNIYWLSIWPMIDGTAVWGWKSSEDHWMDDACWSVHLPQTPAVDWQNLYEPIAVVQSLDLAFVITGGEPCEPCQCGEWEDIEVQWFASDVSIPTGTWTGSCGETVTINHTEAAYKVGVSFGMNCVNCSSPQPAYYWDITGPGGYSYSGGPVTTPFVSFPGMDVSTEVGTYQVVLNAECDGVECPPCRISIIVEPEEEYEHKMHYPQYPEGEDGFSVIATLNAAAPFYVADDWQCSQSGLVTDIHFWGHWDGFSTITEFEIVIAEKISECNVGEMLWQQNFPISEVSVTTYTVATPQGWYNPPVDYNDNVGEGYWQYNIENIDEPFCQQEGEEYWLIIGAYVDNPNEGVWGWRNTTDHFGCNAMYSHSLTSGWQPMYEPSITALQPLDMAFIITGGEPCEPCQCGEWSNIQVVAWETTTQSSTWTGSCGDTLTISPSEYEHGMSVTSTLNCVDCPSSVTPSYSFEVIDPDGAILYSAGGNTASFSPWPVDTYQVVFYATCNDVECSSCILNVQHEEASPCIYEDVTDMAVASDGVTIYIISDGNLFKSSTSGASFVERILPTGFVYPAVNIAVAPDSPNVLIVSDSSANEVVWLTANGGFTWALLPGSPCAGGDTLTDLAVSPELAGTILGRQYFATIADNDAGVILKGDVKEIGTTTVWTSAASSLVTGTHDYMTIQVSPGFVGDRSICVVGAMPAGTAMGVGGVDYQIINTTTSTGVVTRTVQIVPPGTTTDYYGTPAGAGEIIYADIALPSDFDPTFLPGERAYVGIGSNLVQTTDDVYRVDGTIVLDLDVQGDTTNTCVRSIDYSGTIDSGKLLAGEHLTTMVWRTVNPSGSFTTWDYATTPPTGDTDAVVGMHPNFATNHTCYAGTSGLYSCFFISTDGGAIFIPIP